MKLYGAVNDPKDVTTKEYVDKADAALAARVNVLWDALFTDITENPFQITFENLDGVSVEVGIWNATYQRLEC